MKFKFQYVDVAREIFTKFQKLVYIVNLLSGATNLFKVRDRLIYLNLLLQLLLPQFSKVQHLLKVNLKSKFVNF